MRAVDAPAAWSLHLHVRDSHFVGDRQGRDDTSTLVFGRCRERGRDWCTRHRRRWQHHISRFPKDLPALALPCSMLSDSERHATRTEARLTRLLEQRGERIAVPGQSYLQTSRLASRAHCFHPSSATRRQHTPRAPLERISIHDTRERSCGHCCLYQPHRGNRLSPC